MDEWEASITLIDKKTGKGIHIEYQQATQAEIIERLIKTIKSANEYLGAGIN